MNEIFRYSTHFTDEIMGLAFGLTVILGCIIVAYWFYNRRKFHQLSHQIPASVIKNYLDSIIQNSSALKSSLFRGGGIDVADGVPSIVPLSGLGAGPVSFAGGASDEMVAQKSAEISSLHARLKEKDRTITDLESRIRDLGSSKPSGASSEETQILKKEIARLQKELDAAKSAAPVVAGGDAGLKTELTKVTKERDELKERLMEYEIIEEDLANLKRLQQENEQLKATIGQLKGGKGAPAAAPVPVPVEVPVAEPEEVQEVVEAAAEEDMPQMSVEDAPAEEDDIPSPAGDQKLAMPKEDLAPSAGSENEQKSAEELLSEFEKMLG